MQGLVDDIKKHGVSKLLEGEILPQHHTPVPWKHITFFFAMILMLASIAIGYDIGWDDATNKLKTPVRALVAQECNKQAIVDEWFERVMKEEEDRIPD